MEIDFDYDLDETGGDGGLPETLRTAVGRYLAVKAAVPGGDLSAYAWYRDNGALPNPLEGKHFAQLAQLEEFRTRSERSA